MHGQQEKHVELTIDIITQVTTKLDGDELDEGTLIAEGSL